MVSDGISLFLNGLLYIILATTGSLLFFKLRKFNIRVLVRAKTKGPDLVFIDRAAKLKDADGTEWIKLLKTKARLSIPPKEAISITKTGKMYLEVSQVGQDQYRYINIKDNGKDSVEFEVLSNTDRVLAFNQFKKAELQRGISKWDRMMQLAPLASVFMLVMMAFLFWDNITQPSIEASKVLGSVTENLDKVTASQAKLASSLNIMLDKTGAAPGAGSTFEATGGAAP